MTTELARPAEEIWQGPDESSGQRDMAHWAAWLLAGAILLSSFHLWRAGDINLTFSDVLFGVVFAHFAATGRLQSQPFAVLTPVWLICLVAMLGGLLVSSLANGDVLRWIVVGVQYLFAFLCLPMIFLGLSQQRLRQLVLFHIAGVTAIEALGIGGYYLMGSSDAANALFGPDFLTGGRRLGSLVGDANWNGAVIAMALPFVMYAVRSGLIGTVLGLAASAIMLWGLLLSASFTAFVATATAVVIVMLVGRSLPSARVVLAFCAIAVALAASDYRPPDIFEKRVAPALQSGSLDDAGTYGARADLMREAWLKAEDTTFLGLGADRYREFNAEHQPVHNMYLLLWTEGGIISMLAWIFMMLILLLVPLSIIRWHRTESALSLAVMTVFLINTMASPHMYHRLWIVPVLLSIGLALRANTPALIRSEYSLEPSDPTGIAPEGRRLSE